MVSMDPIIRSAPVSSVARQLRRAPERAPVPLSKPAAAPAPKLDAAPVPSAVQVALREQTSAVSADHEAALQEKDAEIARLREAAQQATLELTDAFADAEMRGMEAGAEKGERLALEQLQAQVERVKTLLFQIGQARRKVMDDAEDALVEIAFAAVCKIMGEQGASREAVLSAVRATCAATRERDDLVVRLHPEDAALLRAEDDAEPGLRISADPSVTLGGCIVDSANGSLDARFDTQLDLLAAALKAARAQRLSVQDEV
jgi:flagellar assembly protein FliH